MREIHTCTSATKSERDRGGKRVCKPEGRKQTRGEDEDKEERRRRKEGGKKSPKRDAAGRASSIDPWTLPPFTTPLSAAGSDSGALLFSRGVKTPCK